MLLNRKQREDPVEVALTALESLSEADQALLEQVHSFSWAPFLGSAVMFLIMVSGFTLGAVWLWPFLEKIMVEAAVSSAREIDGIMYESDFGFGMLIWVFAWIFLSSSLGGIFVRRLPMPFAAAAHLGVSEGNDVLVSVAKKFSRATMMSTLHKGGLKALIQAWIVASVRSSARIGIILALIGGLIIAREVNTFSVYSLEGYFRSPFFPWGEGGLTPWRDTDRVELGCNQTSDGPDLVYEVIFDDGSSIRLENGTPVDGQSKLSSLEVIDARLVEAGATFERWRWLDRDPLHPDCMRGYLSALAPEAGVRFKRLLRVGQFDGDKLDI